MHTGSPTNGGSKSRTASGNPSEMGESKSISASRMGTFVAVRGTGSNALATAGERDVRPARPAGEDVLEERGEANAKGNARQQREDHFATPRIPKSVGQEPMPTPLLHLSEHVRVPSKSTPPTHSLYPIDC